MIKDEFGFIKKNKLILLSVLVIMIIPFLYSIFFLKSVWDPYGDTQDLPVAVVNQDQAVDYNGTSMNVGQQTVDKLKKNKQLGWHFVSAKKAADGLKSNEYYTVVTIPKNFSKNAASVLSEHPKKMQLTYKTNDSLNYLSQVISGMGVDALDKEIRANVTNAYASALFEQVKVVGKGMKTAGKGATQINDGLVTLDDGINTYTVGVSTVHDGIQTMSLKVSPLSSGVQQLTTGANQLSSGVNTYVAGTNQVASGISTLNGSVGTLQSGVSTYTGGVSKLAAGINKMSKETSALPTGVEKLVKGSTTLNEGTTNYVNGTDTILSVLSPIVAKLPNTADENLAELAKIQQKLDDVSNGLTKLADTISENSQTNITSADEAFKEGKQEILADEELANDAKVQIALAKMQAGYTGLSQVRTGESQATLSLIQSLSTEFSTIKANYLTEDNIAKIKYLATKVPELKSGIANLQANSSALKDGASDLNIGLKQLEDNIPALLDGVSQLQSGANQLTANNASLNNGTAQLVSGVNQLNAGGQQLAANGSALTSGASQVAGGLTTMNNQLPALTSGVQQLLDGTTQLTDNNKELTGGADKLKGGSKTLAKSLVSGAKEVNGIKLTSATADMFAAPTKTKHTYFSKVTNYGHALAPYVLSLALYVGALVFNFAYPIRKVSRRDGTPTQWFFSKITIGALVATGMAFVEATLIMVGGLHVEHVALFYFIAWLFAMTSMYLVMFLSMWLDNPGRFIAMVLLMLQLGGSGGTFPMEITNHFYNVIHPFLPMSHSIMGFRQAITSGIASGTIAYGIFYMILVAVISLALLWLVMNHLQKKGLMGISQLDDNQKLQAVEK